MDPVSSQKSAPNIDYHSLLDAMVECARGAGSIAKSTRSAGAKTFFKGDKDIATDGDFAAQAHIVEKLSKAFPNLPIVAEESSSHEVSALTKITVDPIDGTAIYEHGGRDWGVLIGLVEDGQPKAGVIHLPERDFMVRALVGEGAFLNGGRVVLQNRRLAEALVGCEVGWWMNNELAVKRLHKLLSEARGVRSLLGSAASGADLLTGSTAAYVHFGGAKIWDFAPIAAAVTAAGGGFVNLDGTRPDWNKLPMSGIFYSNEAILRELLEALRLQSTK